MKTVTYRRDHGWAAPIHSSKGQMLLGDDIHGWLETINTPIQSESRFEQLIAFIEHLIEGLASKSENLEQFIQHQAKLQKKLPLVFILESLKKS